MIRWDWIKKITVKYETEGVIQASKNYIYSGDPVYKDGMATDFILAAGSNFITAKVYYNGYYVDTFDPFYVNIAK